MQLRDYQQAAIDGIHEAFREHRSTLLQLPTGTGKSVVFGDMAAKWKGSVLVLAHRKELVNQGRQHLSHMSGGEWVDVEMADRRAYNARIVMASVQSAMQPKRLRRLQEMGFDLIIADESHRAVAKSWRKVLDAFPEAKVLGVTATPDRGDGVALRKVFESVAYKLDILPAIEAGWLVEPVVERVWVDEVNLDNVKRTAGDFQVRDLDEEMLKGIKGVCHEIAKRGGERQGIHFFPGVKSAEQAAVELNELRPGSARCIHGKTPEVERDMMIRDFKQGRFQHLSNCAVLIEGFDAPRVSLISQVRPSSSRCFVAQCVGRGLRVLKNTVDHLASPEERRAAIAASAKPDCLILDFVGNSKHELVSPEDILGGRYFDPVVAAAKKKQQKASGERINILRVLAEAQSEMERAAKVAAEVKSRSIRIDPFKAFKLKEKSPEWTKRHGGGREPSRRQRDYLERQGIDVNGYDAAAAQQLIGTIETRRRLGLSDYRQQAQLRKWCKPPTNCTAPKAAQAIRYATGAERSGAAVNKYVLERMLK